MTRKFVINSLNSVIFRNTFLMSVAAMALIGCNNGMVLQTTSNGQMLAANTQRAATTPSTNLSATPAPPPIVNYKYASLTNLNMENQGSQITVKPGRSVHATMQYAYHCPDCNTSLNNQIIVGLGGRSAQACIYSGGAQGQGAADFTLKVPAKPGKYEVRFRSLQAMDCTEALKAGWNADNTPSKETTIGMIIVSRKAAA
jgi:hypothetical protein